MLAANGLLSEEFIHKILEEQPRVRRYFYVFPRNNSAAVRSKLIEYLRESGDRELLESFMVCQEPTPEELAVLGALDEGITVSLGGEPGLFEFN